MLAGERLFGKEDLSQKQMFLAQMVFQTKGDQSGKFPELVPTV